MDGDTSCFFGRVVSRLVCCWGASPVSGRITGEALGSVATVLASKVGFGERTFSAGLANIDPKIEEGG